MLKSDWRNKKKERNNNDNNHKVNKENRQHIWNIIYNIVSQIWHILGWTITRMQIHLGIIDDDWLKFGVFKWNKYGIWHATRRFNSLKYFVWATRATKIKKKMIHVHRMKWKWWQRDNNIVDLMTKSSSSLNARI